MQWVQEVEEEKQENIIYNDEDNADTQEFEHEKIEYISMRNITRNR